MRTITWNGMTWVDIISPTVTDLRTLQRRYHFHELDIEDCLSEHERPKVDAYETYLFIVLHIPFKALDSNRILKDEINIFVGQNYLITLHEGKLPPLQALWRRLKRFEKDREQHFGKGPGYFLYELCELLFQSIFPNLDDMNRELRSIETTLFESEDQENMLRAIMNLKRRIIFLKSLLVPQRTVVASLEHKYTKFSPPEDLAIYFQNIIDAIEHQTNMLSTMQEVVDALQETHEGWIRSRTEGIIRVLTIFSVVLLPLNLLATLYGMNVRLPFAEEPWIFEAIISVILLSFLGAFWFFAWKKWW